MQGLIAAAVAGLLIAGSADGVGTQISNPLALSDDQLAGARVVTGFPGQRPPPALRRMIEDGRVSGVTLFDGTVPSRRSVRRLTAELQAIPRPTGSPPLLITVDQEGGLGRRVPRAPQGVPRSHAGGGGGG